MNKALILVDIQNDFIPGGALGVPGGNEVVAVANETMKYFDIVVATQDWHPADHGSFASCHKGKKPGESIILAGTDQILWPDHCIENSKGAELVSGLNTDRIKRVFKKGTNREIDSYSAFFDNARKNDTGLENYLRASKINNITLMGLATDYCVKFSALDAVSLGFKTSVISEGIRGVNINPEDSDRAVKEMQKAGVLIISSENLRKL